MSNMRLTFTNPAPVAIEVNQTRIAFLNPTPILGLQLPGIQGVPGRGLPAGGTTGQVPRKASATDYDVVWGDAAGLSDGDKGDITVSGGGAVWTIDAGVITPGKLSALTVALFATAAQGALAESALQPGATIPWADVTGKPSFAAVAFTGSYADLAGLPALFDGTWASLSGKPATFPPSAHGHPATEITGLAAIATTGSASDLGTGTVPPARLSLTKAQLNTAVSDGDVLFVGDVAGATPAGSSGAIQINSGGVFGAAADFREDGGQLRLNAIATPTAPASGGVKVYTATKTGQRDGLAMLFPSGRETRLQEDLADFQTLRFQPAPNSAALVGDGTLPMTITGTATSGAVQTSNLFLKWPRIEARVATPATNAIAGFRGGGNLVSVGRDANAPGGFRFVGVWGASGFVPPSTHRGMCGLTANTGAPTDVEPSTLVDGVWMGWDAADANVQIMHNDASGAATKIDLGSSFPVPTAANTDLYMLELTSLNSLTQSVGYRVTRFNAADRTVAAEATGTITTNLPSVTTLLSPRVWCSAGGTSSAIGVALYGFAIGLEY